MIAQTERPNVRPCLVLGYADSAHAAQTGRALRRQGWEVHMAGTAADVHRLVRATAPRVVVLDVDLPDESGWLTCAKLRVESSEQQVVMLATEPSESDHEFAAFLGAKGLVRRDDPLSAFIDENAGTAAAWSQAS